MSFPSTVAVHQQRSSPKHTVLTHIFSTGASHGGWKAKQENPNLWHPNYVKMPFSKKAEVTTCDVKMRTPKKSRSRWKVIHTALTKPIKDYYDLKEAILSYSDKAWDFGGLQVFLNDHLDNEKRADFIDNVLPKMAKLALDLPQLCSEPIPLLKRGSSHSITMSQEQAACLLANAFFCTFPESNKKPAVFNFNKLYQKGIRQMTREKLKCLLHYFKTVTDKMPQGNITYRRQMISHQELPKWEKQKDLFSQLHVSSGGMIEDDGSGMMQVDFANKYVGGGVLGNGCLQEEICFIICPELIVLRLFTEVLEPNEAVVVTGPQRYSKYCGYQASFQWVCGYDDQMPRDSRSRRCRQIVVIDALKFTSHSDQFEPNKVCRELNKAYVGFYEPYNNQLKTAIATGNWGCGAFGGDGRLKALIQLMAAAVAGRDVCYFTYHDNALAQDIYDIHKLITERSLTVGDVWRYTCDYWTSSNSSAGSYKTPSGSNAHIPVSKRQRNVFEFIKEQVMGLNRTTVTPPHSCCDGTTDQRKTGTVEFRQTQVTYE